jgi:hypothetical protein
MASLARLERLRKLVQADMDALPDRVPEPIVSDDNFTGGVALEPSKQTTTDVIQPRPKQTTKKPNTDRRYIWLKDAESSYNPLPMSKPTTHPNPSTILSITDLKRGDLAPAQQHFAPIQALARYPYRFCNRSHSQDIASAFFDQGKFWAREWDL